MKKAQNNAKKGYHKPKIATSFDIDDNFDILTESNGWDDATAVTGDVDFGTADDFE